MNRIEFEKVVKLAELLERQKSKVPLDRSKTFEITGDDRILWDTFFKELILTDILEDGKAFGQPTNNTSKGVGSDGKASAAEYYHLLMVCYRYLYNALTSGEIFLKHSGWHIEEAHNKSNDTYAQGKEEQL